MKKLRLIAVISAVAMAAAFVAQGDDGASKNQGATNPAAGAPKTSDGSLKEPVKSVLDRYLKIQAALAGDSNKGVSANATAIS